VRPSVIVQEDNTGTKHPAPLVLNGPSQFLQCIQKLYHRAHFTVGGSWNKSFHLLNSCNDATVRTQEVPLVHAPCYIIALSCMCSRFSQYKVCWLWDEWETYFVDMPRMCLAGGYLAV
jgi:hypothetical protein